MLNMSFSDFQEHFSHLPESKVLAMLSSLFRYTMDAEFGGKLKEIF